MEKSGQGSAYDNWVIDRPELKSFARRWGELTLTALLWAVWIYWITPVLAGVLSACGGTPPGCFARSAAIDGILRASLLALTVILGVMVGWILYNYCLVLFVRGDRRNGAVPVSSGDIAERLGITEYSIARRASGYSPVEVRAVDDSFVVTSSRRGLPLARPRAAG